MNDSDASEDIIDLSTLLELNCISLSYVTMERHTFLMAKVAFIYAGIWQKGKHILVGSRAEGTGIDNHHAFKLLYPTDTDLIEIIDDIDVFEPEHIVNTEKVPGRSQFLREPDNAFPGYAMLINCNVEKNDLFIFNCKEGIIQVINAENVDYLLDNKQYKEERYKREKHRNKRVSIHGPAVNSTLSHEDSFIFNCEEGRIKLIKDENVVNYDYLDLANVDTVFCLRGEEWPVEASEWLSRKRYFHWPSKELYQAIMESGYFLAGVGSKDSKESESQWRISFNTAEKLIMESLNETQIQCLIFLKLLKTILLSKVAGKNVTSYTMKTVMFWCLEETSENFWQSGNLESCVVFCLLKLKDFIEKEFLPNYFIRKRNQFVASEFSTEKQLEIKKILESFISAPIGSIRKYFPFYHASSKIPHPELGEYIQDQLILTWFVNKVKISSTWHVVSLRTMSDFYKGYNIQNIFCRCNNVVKQLSTLTFSEPFIKRVRNCMGVLQYVLLREGMEKQVDDSEKRRKCVKYMILSVPGDRPHTNLRIAACLLDYGVKKECLDIIRTVTDNKEFYNNMSKHCCTLATRMLTVTIDNFKQLSSVRKKREIEIYNRVIKNDLVNPNLFTTLAEFKRYEDEGQEVGAYNLFIVLSMGCFFDVTFMLAEVQILPKPAALELLLNREKMIGFQPVLFGLLLEYMWHVKHSSPKEDREKVLKSMQIYSSLIPGVQHYIGINFMIYCCALQRDYCSASKYLMKSIVENPCPEIHNVAYTYMKYIINLLLNMFV